MGRTPVDDLAERAAVIPGPSRFQDMWRMAHRAHCSSSPARSAFKSTVSMSKPLAPGAKAASTTSARVLSTWWLAIAYPWGRDTRTAEEDIHSAPHLLLGQRHRMPPQVSGASGSITASATICAVSCPRDRCSGREGQRWRIAQGASCLVAHTRQAEDGHRVVVADQRRSLTSMYFSRMRCLRKPLTW